MKVYVILKIQHHAWCSDDVSVHAVYQSKIEAEMARENLNWLPPGQIRWNDYTDYEIEEHELVSSELE